MKPRQVCRRIERLGGEFDGYEGGHRKYVVRYGERGRVRTSVPMHGHDVPAGTRSKIQRDLAPALGEGWLR